MGNTICIILPGVFMRKWTAVSFRYQICLFSYRFCRYEMWYLCKKYVSIDTYIKWNNTFAVTLPNLVDNLAVFLKSQLSSKIEQICLIYLIFLPIIAKLKKINYMDPKWSPILELSWSWLPNFSNLAILGHACIVQMLVITRMGEQWTLAFITKGY